MDTHDFDKNKELNSYDFISEPIKMKFNEYNIQTIGQLLSATKGLKNTDFLFYTPEELLVLEKLTEMISEKIRKEYNTFSFTHPTGLIKIKNEGNEKEGTNSEK